MPNYCSNYGTLTAKNENAKKLFRKILANKKEIEEGTKNFCDFFIPEPDYSKLVHIPEGYRITSGGWNGESCWLSHPDQGKDNIPFTEKEKEILTKAGRGYLGSYDFCSQVWGSKWGLCDAWIDGDEEQIEFSGTSAWCPFTNLFREFFEVDQEELPEEEKIIFDLVYDYDERGCDFAGRQQISWYKDDEGEWVGYDNINDCEWEEGMDEFPEHGTLPSRRDHFYNQLDYACYNNDNWDQVKDGDLVMFDYGDEKFCAIILKSQETAMIAGVGNERILVCDNEWMIEEF